MTQTVYHAFVYQKELNLMLGNKNNVTIGDRDNFIFITKHGRPVMPANRVETEIAKLDTALAVV